MIYKTNSVLYAEDPFRAFREQYDEEDVFLTLYPDIAFDRRTHSPLRQDNFPSWIVSTKYGPLLYKDFSTGESGNIFEFVLQYEKLANKYEALSFLLETYENKSKGSPVAKEKRSYQTKIGVKYRDFNSLDKEYWSAISISKMQLDKYYVRPISHVFVNDYCFKADPLAYAYHEYKEHTMTFKIYQPYNPDHKWMNNSDSSVWEGWDQMLAKDSRVLFVTKSRKDVMFIDQHTDYCAVSMQSEGVIPKLHVFQELIEKKHFTKLFLLYDNDEKGVAYSYKVMEEVGNKLNFKQIFIDMNDGKDITDYSKQCSQPEAVRFLHRSVETYEK
jgi:hypothetical protein